MATNSDSIPGWFRRKRQASTDEAEIHNEETSSMSTAGGGSETKPVVVWEAANRLEAQIVKGRLESEGIPAIIQGEAVGTIYGLTTGGLAETSVLVPAPLADRAREILAEDVVWDEADIPDEDQ